ncbi:4Fe-4S binding protein [Ruegeria sp. HKCCD8929]|uniref:4Fe-4S binding protein n=1 Tax=Ruegeria sp. HKCCD8929 TaxID=2683006 RepID=UPI001C2CBE0F|nr:4Fe-4S binding protein [Ruegeria sp. HKCCD8929]
MSVTDSGEMIHPGLPLAWGLAVLASMLLVGGVMLIARADGESRTRHFELAAMPGIGGAISYAASSTWLLRVLKLLFLALFLLIIASGLYGTPIPERNAATVLTWNLWWSGLIVSVFFAGSIWCAVCPWNTFANLLVNRRLTGRARRGSRLVLRVPKYLRNLWPALIMFIGLTWLELGVGVTVSPYATAILALVIVILATASLAIFERRAFCRFFCPVGRTVGFYSQLAPVEQRPRDTQICADCTTLECYYGSETVEPCPTHQLMGRMRQNTFCTSCGNCARSCPESNVVWRLRSPSAEAIRDARPHWDEAWFMLGLLALTGFHGLTMMAFWDGWISALARAIGDSGQLLTSFSLGLAASLAAPFLLYAAAVWMTCRVGGLTTGFATVFSRFAFVALPLAFAYHLAHNLNHLVREGSSLSEVLVNPFGQGALPLGDMEKHVRAMDMAIPHGWVHAIQAGLVALGFLIAMRVIQSRGQSLLPQDGRSRQIVALAPMALFAAGMTAFHLWLLMQPMVMRL